VSVPPALAGASLSLTQLTERIDLPANAGGTDPGVSASEDWGGR
jgi:hypothetical protein